MQTVLEHAPRLGLCGDLIPTDPALMGGQAAAVVSDLGFTGVTVHIGSGLDIRPGDLATDTCVAIREAFAGCGVAIVQSWGFGASLVGADPAALAGSLETLEGACRVARDLGAEAVITGCGSLSPAGRYAPHPGNHTQETRRRLAEALRRVGDMAGQHGVVLALEPHVLTALDTPEHVREVVDAAGSPAVRVNLDIANFVGSLDALWNSTGLIERAFDALEGVIVSGHVKDVVVGDDFVLHLSETVPGDGMLDLRTLVRLFAERLPGRYLFVEHVPAGQVPRAKQALDRIVGEVAA